ITCDRHSVSGRHGTSRSSKQLVDQANSARITVEELPVPVRRDFVVLRAVSTDRSLITVFNDNGAFIRMNLRTPDPKSRPVIGSSQPDIFRPRIPDIDDKMTAPVIINRQVKIEVYVLCILTPLTLVEVLETIPVRHIVSPPLPPTLIDHVGIGGVPGKKARIRDLHPVTVNTENPPSP